MDSMPTNLVDLNQIPNPSLCSKCGTRAIGVTTKITEWMIRDDGYIFPQGTADFWCAVHMPQGAK